MQAVWMDTVEVFTHEVMAAMASGNVVAWEDQRKAAKTQRRKDATFAIAN